MQLEGSTAAVFQAVPPWLLTCTVPADAVVWLLHRGADLTVMKEDGWRDTALHYAAGSGSLDCVQALLLAWGADATAANALGGCRQQLVALVR